jgi:flagellar basal body-associated protein FliL
VIILIIVSFLVIVAVMVTIFVVISRSNKDEQI